MNIDEIIYKVYENRGLKLVLIRGLPGSGKSTLAKDHLMKDCYFVNYFEADQFFGDKYKWSGDLMGAAHSWCRLSAEKALLNGDSVIVSNTFTTQKEIEPYLELANKYKAELIIIACTSNFGSIHNVPEESMTRMKARWVNCEGELIYDANEANI